MSVVERTLGAPRERVGAVLERAIAGDPGWSLGAVERELGEVSAQAHPGLGRAPEQVRFELSYAPSASTAVRVQVTRKSRWTSLAAAQRRIDRLLDAVALTIEADT